MISFRFGVRDSASGLVLGGGNIYRGGQAAAEVRRVTADHIGMLATVQNALVLAEYLRNRNYHADIYSAVQMDKVAMFYTHDRAEKSLREGKICIFCAGTGNPYLHHGYRGRASCDGAGRKPSDEGDEGRWRVLQR